MKLITLGLMLSLAPAALAQTPGPVAPPAPLHTGAGAVTPSPSTYVLGPDDVISIHVINSETFDKSDLVVPPDGKSQLDLIGTIVIAGKTTDQLAQELTAKWSDYVKNISVSVTLAHKRAQDAISVYGYTPKTGSVPFHHNIRLVDVIAEMGGAGSTGDLTQVVVTHPDGTSETLDMSHPENKANSPSNIELKEGDLVFVPQRQEYVTVLGKVEKPGRIEYTDGMTVLDSLDKAGGAKLEDADLTSATLTHDGHAQPIDLDALINKGNNALNIKVSPGDTLDIPESRNRTYVFGAVGRSGYYNFKPGDKLLDALKEVGGPTPDADLKHVNIIEVDNNKNASKVTKVNVDDLLRNGTAKNNVALKAGDIVYVPEKKKESKKFSIFDALLGLNIIRGVNSLINGN